MLLLGQFVEKVALVLKSHIFVDEIKAQREVMVGGQQLHVDQAVDSASPGWNNSDVSGSSWLICNKKLSSESGAGWSWQLSIAERLIPGLQLEKVLEGGRRLVHGASQGLLHRNRSKRQIHRTTERTAVSVFLTFMSDRIPKGLMGWDAQNWVEQ